MVIIHIKCEPVCICKVCTACRFVDNRYFVLLFVFIALNVSLLSFLSYFSVDVSNEI